VPAKASKDVTLVFLGALGRRKTPEVDAAIKLAEAARSSFPRAAFGAKIAGWQEKRDARIGQYALALRRTSPAIFAQTLRDAPNLLIRSVADLVRIPRYGLRSAPAGSSKFGSVAALRKMIARPKTRLFLAARSSTP
jgi:hypothetical protein